jgi:hypothetical protein
MNMQQKISKELRRLIFNMEVAIADVLGHPECPEHIKERLLPLANEMNAEETCHLYGFRSPRKTLVDRNDDGGNGGGESLPTAA